MGEKNGEKKDENIVVDGDSLSQLDAKKKYKLKKQNKEARKLLPV
jgi:hypothetical protein